ncbi:hypothetical protein LINGRAHAP2_LOCUS22648, partial [Linum grandiflorum]
LCRISLPLILSSSSPILLFISSSPPLINSGDGGADHRPSPSSLSLCVTAASSPSRIRRFLPLSLTATAASGSHHPLFFRIRRRRQPCRTPTPRSSPHIDDFSLQNEGTLKRLADDLGPPKSGMLDEEWLTMTMSTTISDLLLCILFLQKLRARA